MQFKEFDWLSGHGVSHYTMPYKYGKRMLEFSGAFLFPFQSSFPRFWAVFNKTCNYSTRACWIWDDYSQLGATRLVGCLSSHIQRALVEYLLIIL